MANARDISDRISMEVNSYYQLIKPTVKNIWKSYIWTADKEVSESDPRSNVHYLGSSENKAWKKIQACTGFEPMTSAIPVQRS